MQAAALFAFASAVSGQITEVSIPALASSPSGIASGPDGNLWFVESQANKVGRITQAGVITEYSIPTPASTPFSIVAGPDGAMWFTESSGGHIGRITTSGAITEYSSGGLPGARGIAAGPDGNLWFTYGAGWGRISPAGTLISTPPRIYPSPGPSISIVKGPDNAMYITYIIDILGGTPGTIERVTPDGQGQLFTVPPRPAGGNAGPYGITSGPDGALWITEVTAGRIARMTTAGAFTEYSLPTGSASGPGFIAVGPDGALWFSEEVGRIGRITTSGAITEFSAPDPASGPFGIVAGPDGAIWFTEQSGNRIGRLPLSTTQGTGALQFVPVAPCRVLDTRNANGPLGGPAMQGGTSRSFPVSSSNCGIPASATAFSLNLTVVPHGPLGYVTLWPTGQSQPLVSTLNSLDGRIKANAAIVPAGPSGSVSAYATDTTDLVLDIDGYFATTPGLQFFPLPPCRIADTRNATGSLGGPSIPGGRRTFPILSSNCGIPTGAQAYSLNMTVVPNGPLAYLTVWPTGQTQPFVSTLNDMTGTIVANAAIVPAGANGAIDVFATDATNLVIDVNGYFAAPAQGGSNFYPVPPCRMMDSRNTPGTLGGPALAPGNARLLPLLSSACNLPPNAAAYSLNATVVPAGPLGYLSLWPSGQTQPFVSTLNAVDGSITANAAIVPAGNGGGSISAMVTNQADLVLDVNGYFGP